METSRPVTFQLSQATRDRLARVYPDLKVRVIRTLQDVYNCHGWQMQVCQGLRSFADQEAVWEQGRKLVNGVWVYLDPIHHDGVVTYAKPGDSWHHFSAVDCCFAGADPFLDQLGRKDIQEFEHRWSEYGRFAKGNGLDWGGDWEGKKKDRPHAQIRYGLELHEVQSLYAYGGLRAVWTKFDQIRGMPPGSEWIDILRAEGLG